MTNVLSSNSTFAALELAALIVAVIVALAYNKPPAPLTALERLLTRLSRHRGVLIAIPAILAVGGRLLVLPFSPAPVPRVHDEFSYLLAADTFAHGRMTNPPSPMWTHLETFHELQQPSYSSMYPVGQGLFLAFGEVLGNPWIGVLLSVALMCSAVTWMLCGCFPAQWALAGGLLAVCRFAIFSYWVDSYWGGAVAALGGALVLGAGIRLLGNNVNFERRTSLLMLCLTAGSLMLANSRPYEGLLFSAPLLFVLLRRFLTGARKLSVKQLTKASLLSAVTAAAGISLMCIYSWRVTGSPLLLPYQLHQLQYSTTQPFIWQPMLAEPHYRYAVFRDYYEPQAAFYQRAHTWSGWIHETFLKFTSILMFYFWPLGLLIIMTLRRLWLSNQFVRLAVLTGVTTFAGLSLEIWPMMLHYAAPMVSVAMLLSVAALKNVSAFSWKGRPVGRLMAWSLALLCVSVLTVRAGAAALGVSTPDQGLLPWFTVRQGNINRVKVEDRLKQTPGKHLVVVRYDPNHDPSDEWVYNAAILESAKVIWAREQTPAQDAELLHFFSNRAVWLLEPDKNPVRLVPYISNPLSSSAR